MATKLVRIFSECGELLHKLLFASEAVATRALGSLCIALRLHRELATYRELFGQWWQRRDHEDDDDRSTMRELRAGSEYGSEDEASFNFYIDSDGNWHDGTPSTPSWHEPCPL